MMVESLNKLDGIACNEVEGALYAFPRLVGLEGKASSEGAVPADAKYCMALLDATGIVTVPGSGFGQVPGTLHVRTTILPPENEVAETMARWAKFHQAYMAN
jgi:aspartate/methionine/tyrosine aminotransferase